MSTRSTVATVDLVVEGLVETERFLTDRQPWAGQVFAAAIDSALSTGYTRLKVGNPPPMKPSDSSQIHFTAQDAATRVLWQQYRTVYDIDPSLWEELGSIDEDTTLPAALFAHLPHRDPFIVWPELAAQKMDDDDDRYSRPLGCFINGHTRVVGGGWPVSTHSEHADGALSITIVSVVQNGNGIPVRIREMGGVTDSVIARTTLDLDAAGEFRVGDLIDTIAARYHNDPTIGGGLTFEESVRPMLRQIISVLIYLCATNADLRPLPAGHSQRAAKGTGRKPPRIVAVGSVVGAGLRAYRQRAAAEAPAGERKSPRAHVRRAHFHTYRTGPGRQEILLKWLSPIPVNADGNTPTTVHRMRKAAAS